jgi:hypothetical protein
MFHSWKKLEKRILSLRLHHVWCNALKYEFDDDGIPVEYDLTCLLPYMPTAWKIQTYEQMQQIFVAYPQVETCMELSPSQQWICMDAFYAIEHGVAYYDFLYKGKCYLQLQYTFRIWLQYFHTQHIQHANQLKVIHTDHIMLQKLIRRTLERFLYYIPNPKIIIEANQTITLSLNDSIQIAPACMYTLSKHALDLKTKYHLKNQQRWAYMKYISAVNVSWDDIHLQLNEKVHIQKNQIKKIV